MASITLGSGWTPRIVRSNVEADIPWAVAAERSSERQDVKSAWAGEASRAAVNMPGRRREAKVIGRPKKSGTTTAPDYG